MYEVKVMRNGTYHTVFKSYTLAECKEYAKKYVSRGKEIQRIDIHDSIGWCYSEYVTDYKL